MAVTEHRSVTPSEARTRVLRAFKNKRPVFLWGPPGVGKSDIIAQLTEEVGGYMIDLRLGQMEPTDLRGIPFYNKELRKMDWAPPVDLPDAETQERWQLTTPQWPIMHAVTYGVSRDQMMAQHKANHIQVAYAKDAAAADACLFGKACFADALGIKVNVCGTLRR